MTDALRNAIEEIACPADEREKDRQAERHAIPMVNEHSLAIHATCAVNGCPDEYQATVRTSRVIRVEDILEAVRVATVNPILQEDLTARLARVLRCQVETTGEHSGVRTKSTCGVIA